MPELYVLRHGIAVPHGTPEVAEDDRPLTPKGEKRVRQIGRGLGRIGVRPDRIVSSPLPRALKTAEIVAEVLDIADRLETADALRADRDAASIRDWVRTRPEANLMLVGHNPGLSNLLGLLLAGQPIPSRLELRKGGIAALSAQAGMEKPEMSLDWLARPCLFRRLARR
jgi:phosphohistidine phosphatase